MERVAVLLAVALLAGCAGGGGGGADVSDRLSVYHESACENSPATDRHGLAGTNCSDVSAGQRDLYIDWAHDHLPEAE